MVQLNLKFSNLDYDALEPSLFILRDVEFEKRRNVPRHVYRLAYSIARKWWTTSHEAYGFRVAARPVRSYVFCNRLRGLRIVELRQGFRLRRLGVSW